MERMKSLKMKVDGTSGRMETERGAVLRRHLSEMGGMYANGAAAGKLIAAGDPLVYEFYDLGMAEKAGELAFGTSVVYPGQVGDEFFMTKGHFHRVLETAEVYHCLSGHGVMLMESPEGAVEYREMAAGDVVYVPGRYAHRSVNISGEDALVTFFVFRADAGHDYGSIEGRGFRKLVVADGTGYAVVDNPRWNGA